MKTRRKLESKPTLTFRCPMIKAIHDQPCGRGGMADATDLRKLECSPGKPAMQNCPNSGKPEMAIPSQARPEHSSREGVETRRAAPKPRTLAPDLPGDGEGIVQTANL